MHPNEKLVARFYEAFARRDGAGMAACYAPHATFKDPVFPGLRGPQVGAMWRMLCSGAKDLNITFGSVLADANAGSARWEATYTFSKTGRRVHNVITANFAFADGKIVAHVDSFSFWRWSRQALGPPGLLLGWTPLVRATVRREAAARLAKFMADAPAVKARSTPKSAKVAKGPRKTAKAGRKAR